MKYYAKKTVRLFIGLFLCALGTVCAVQANIGLAPWEAFHIGLSLHTGCTLGIISILAGLAILVIDVLLKEKIGFGTICNIVGIGTFIDLIQWLKIIPAAENFAMGVLLMLLGQTIIAFGTFFYVGAGLCSGPRDSLLAALSKRAPRIPIGVIRSLIEGTALLIGFLLGAKIGLGTIIAVVGIGFILQLVFKITRFDIKSVTHEKLSDMAVRLRET